METSPWDNWRAATAPRQVVTATDNLRFDALARAPEQPIVEARPYWLA
jgi:hypothetical protein